MTLKGLPAAMLGLTLSVTLKCVATPAVRAILAVPVMLPVTVSVAVTVRAPGVTRVTPFVGAVKLWTPPSALVKV